MNVFMPEKHVAGGKLLAPTGGLKAPNDMETTEITAEDMAKIKADFVDAAKAAKELGFDGIQLHCAHGYLLSQFLDPNTNQRTDAYGGSAENRFRFPGECLTAIREAVGKDYPVLIKVNTNCGGEYKASYAEDILYFCRQFEALGADAIELSGYNWLGLGKKQVPTFYLDQAKAIRQEVKIPLILGRRRARSGDGPGHPGRRHRVCLRLPPFICQPDFVRHLGAGRGFSLRRLHQVPGQHLGQGGPPLREAPHPPRICTGLTFLKIYDRVTPDKMCVHRTSVLCTPSCPGFSGWFFRTKASSFL